MSPWRAIVDAAHASGAFAAARPIFAGRGAILMFHEIQNDPASELMTGTSTERFERFVLWAQSEGWDIVTLDEAMTRLAVSDDRRFAVITFDDGYRDNVQNALPVMERHNLPFTVFIPTLAVTGEMYSWWLALRHLFLANDSVEIEPMARRFYSPAIAEKTAALREVEQWVHEDRSRAPLLRDVFAAAAIDLQKLNRRYFLDEGELRRLAGHPLATIGAHGVTHEAMPEMLAALVRDEMTSNRAWLETVLDRSVNHFAYPYGAAGEREAEIAAAVGFSSAVRGSGGPVTDPIHPQLLPRVGVSERTSPASFDAAISGVRNLGG